jgi:hypothetical protein
MTSATRFLQKSTLIFKVITQTDHFLDKNYRNFLSDSNVTTLVIPAIHLSFPRRRESTGRFANELGHPCHKASLTGLRDWIPASAGMTIGIGQFESKII